MLDLIPLGPFDLDRRTGFVGVVLGRSGPRSITGDTLAELVQNARPETVALPPWMTSEAQALGVAIRQPSPEHLTVAGLMLLAQQPRAGVVAAREYGLVVYETILEYLREEPWTWVHADDPVILTLRGARHRVAVLGRSGQMYGLSVYRGGRASAGDSYGLYLEDVPELGVRLMKALGVRGVPILFGVDARGEREVSTSELEVLVAALRGAVELKQSKKLAATLRVPGLRGELEVQIDASSGEASPIAVARVDAKVGRNDPCPCGSGKKYKKCCLQNEGARPVESSAPAPARAPEHAPAPEHELDRRLFERLTAATEARWPGFIGAARATCPLSGDELAMAGLGNTWIACHAQTPDGRTPLVAYLDQNLERLQPDERRWAEATARAHLSLHEVVEVAPPFVTVRDVLLKAEARVRDVGLSGHARAGLGVLARVVHVEGKALIAGAHTRLLGPVELETTRARAERRLSKAGIPRTPEGLRSEAAGRALMELALEALDTRGAAPIRVEGGSAPERVEDVFDVRSVAHVRAKLAASAALIDAPEGWTLVGPFIDESVLRPNRAALSLRGARLHVESWSRAHADEARREVEALVGAGQLTHRARSHEDLALPATPRGVALQALVATGIVDPAGVQREQDRLWLAQPVPALNGKSPREAARDGRTRKKLDALLKERALHADQPGALDLRAHLGVAEGGRRLSDAERAPRLPRMSEVLLDWVAAIDGADLATKRAAFERLARALAPIWNASREGVTEAERAELLARIAPEDRLAREDVERLVRRRLRLFADEPREVGAVEVVWSATGPALRVMSRIGG